MALNIVAHRRSNTQRCLYRMTTYSQCLVHIINTFQNGHILFWAHSKNSTFQKGHIPFWAHSKKVTFCLEHIPNGTNFVLSAFQKGHTPIWAHSKLCTVYFDQIPKRAHSKKITFQIKLIPFRPHSIKSTVWFEQKKHIPKRHFLFWAHSKHVHSIYVTFQKSHTPKTTQFVWAHSKKSLFPKGHILFGAHSILSIF